MLPDTEVGEVDVVERETRDRRSRNGGRPGDRLGHVILPLVHGGGRGGGRGEADLQLVALDARLEDRERLERRRAEDVTGAKIEF